MKCKFISKRLRGNHEARRRDLRNLLDGKVHCGTIYYIYS